MSLITAPPTPPCAACPPHTQPAAALDRCPAAQVLFSVMQSLRPEMPSDSDLPGRPGASLPAYKQLMADCWQQEAELRPGFEQILCALDDMRAADAAARAGERASGSDMPGSSRRTSHSGDSGMCTPAPASRSNGNSTFGSGGRSMLDDAFTSGGTAPRGGAAGSATSVDASVFSVAATHAAEAGGLSGGTAPSSGPSAPPPVPLIAPLLPAAPGLADDGQPSPASGHSSAGPFGPSEPSFAFFAAGGTPLPSGAHLVLGGSGAASSGALSSGLAGSGGGSRGAALVAGAAPGGAAGAAAMHADGSSPPGGPAGGACPPSAAAARCSGALVEGGCAPGDGLATSAQAVAAAPELLGPAPASQHATGDSVRAPNRHPSRLRRRSGPDLAAPSSPPPAGVPAAGFGAASSPRPGPRPASPFAAALEAESSWGGVGAAALPAHPPQQNASRPSSPFAAAQQEPGVSQPPARTSSPFAAVQADSSPGGSPRQLPAHGACTPRPASPFAAAQLDAGSDADGGEPRAPPVRPSSPFASVQRADIDAVQADADAWSPVGQQAAGPAGTAAACAVTTPRAQRATSPFAAANRQAGAPE